MSELSDLVEIKFPKLINEEKLREIFLDLAVEKPCTVTLSINNSWFFGKPEGLREERTFMKSPLRSGGNICNIRKERFTSLYFDLEVAFGEEDERGYSGLRFFTPPGYEVNELNTKEVEFMRELGSYFERIKF